MVEGASHHGHGREYHCQAPLAKGPVVPVLEGAPGARLGSKEPHGLQGRICSSFALQESMETKTESLDDVQLSLSLTQTIAELQFLVSQQCNWEPINKLERQAAQTDWLWQHRAC